MNKKTLVLAAGLMAACITANAQTETLDYQGSVLSSGEMFSGSVVLNAPLGADVTNATVIPASFTFLTPFFIQTFAPGNVLGYDGSTSFSFTTANSVIVGWNINFALETSGGTNSPISIDAVISDRGDSYTLQFLGCAPNPANPDPCQPLSASNSIPGSWTVKATAAPELDPASAVAGLTLLLGGLAVMRGRRKLNSVPHTI